MHRLRSPAAAVQEALVVVPSVVAACVAAALVVEPAVAVEVVAAVEPSGVVVAWAVAP